MVIKHGALGDLVQAFDGFATLRAGHPEAHLALLTTGPFAGLARAMPFFDEILIDPRASGFNLSAFLKMRKLFRSGWSRIYDFQSSRRTRRYFQHLIPADVEFVGVPSMASHVLPDMTGVNNRDRMIKTAELGGNQFTEAPLTWLQAEKNNWPAKAAILVPGCSPAKPQKRWPAERFAELAILLHEKGYTPILAGTSLDRSVGDAIMGLAPMCQDYIGRTNLMELASFMAGASMVVGNDTGPVFLGARLGAPTLMVMSKHTDPAMSAPVGPNADWIKQDDISAITADDVMAAATRITAN